MSSLRPSIKKKRILSRPLPRRGVQMSLLGPSWGALGALLGGLGAVLGSSWGPLGALLGRLGALLGPSWGALGAVLGASWEPWRPLGAILEAIDQRRGAPTQPPPSGALKPSLGALLGRSWGALGVPLGPSWGPSRSLWGLSWAILGPT